MSQAAWSQFLPVIISLNGYSNTQVQLMTMPVYVAAGVSAIVIGYLSDRFRVRGPFLGGAFAVTAAGWLILLVSKNKDLSYAATFLIGMGSTPTVILEMAWLNNNIVGYTKKFVFSLRPSWPYPPTQHLLRRIIWTCADAKATGPARWRS